ncbi:MAG: hypothetical protein AAF514_19510 [Verrucomicrobiota bacterium]
MPHSDSSDSDRRRRLDAAVGARKKKVVGKKKAPTKKKTTARRTTVRKKGTSRKVVRKTVARKAAGARNRPVRPRRSSRAPATSASRRTTPVDEPGPSLLAILEKLAFVIVIGFLALVTNWTLFQSITRTDQLSLVQTPEFAFFCFGLGLFLLAYLAARRFLLFAYVFGHELTHALTVILFRGRVDPDIRISSEGGHIMASKSNLMIALSPYFVPFYTACALIIFLLAGLIGDLQTTHQIASLEFRFLDVMYLAIGFSGCMHMVFTVMMISRDQPDLRLYGTVVSLLVIFFANLVVVTAMLIAAVPELELLAYAREWMANADAILTFFFNQVARFFR